jgi:hypothetical protein
MSKRNEMQRLIRLYKDETGETQVDMKKVAQFAVNKGWPIPIPKDPIDILAKQFSTAAREEIKHDKSTGRPYRVNHALPYKQGHDVFYLWVDIDEAPRSQMHKSLTLRREQMVGDGLQLSYDADHWNSSHQNEDKIQLEMDLSFDIELRKNAADAEQEAA